MQCSSSWHHTAIIRTRQCFKRILFAILFFTHFSCSSSTNTLTGEEIRPHVNDCLPTLEPMLSMVLPATLLQNVGELTWIIQDNGQDKLILSMYFVYYCTLHTIHVFCVLLYSTYYPCILCTIALYILSMYCVYYCTLHTIHVFCVLLYSTYYPCIVCTIVLYTLPMYCVYYCTLHTIHVLCVLHTVLIDRCFIM